MLRPFDYDIFIRYLCPRIKIQRRIYIVSFRAPAELAKRSWQLMLYTYHQCDKPHRDRRARKARGKDL